MRSRNAFDNQLKIALFLLFVNVSEGLISLVSLHDWSSDFAYMESLVISYHVGFMNISEGLHMKLYRHFNR